MNSDQGLEWLVWRIQGTVAGAIEGWRILDYSEMNLSDGKKSTQYALVALQLLTLCVPPMSAGLNSIRARDEIRTKP